MADKGEGGINNLKKMGDVIYGRPLSLNDNFFEISDIQISRIGSKWIDLYFVALQRN